ncbi:MAG: hypothetical protein Tsb0034_06310 [Ekhidna sp.]
MKEGYVYVRSNFNRTIVYIGVTNNIETRVLEYKAGIGSMKLILGQSFQAISNKHKF